jgi:hypothetical protein
MEISEELKERMQEFMELSYRAFKESGGKVNLFEKKAWKMLREKDTDEIIDLLTCAMMMYIGDALNKNSIEEG